MRPDLSPATLALLESGEYDVHWLVEVANGSGTLIDVSDRVGGVSGAIPSPDAPIGTLRLEFLREVSDDPATSLAPLVASDLNVLDDRTSYAPLLQVGRVVRASLALTVRGAERPASGFYEVFRGRVARVGWGGWYGGASVDCNDQAAALQRTKSEAEYTYAEGTAVEAAIQQVLNNNGFASVVLSVPVATSAVLEGDYKPGLQKSVWEQVQALASSIGHVCWYRYDASGVAHLTLFAPERTKEASDLTFAHIHEVERLDVDEEEIGNVLYDQYSDSDDVRQLAGPVEDAGSIAKYGDIRRTFFISEEEGSPITTASGATGLLTTILPDLADPDAIASYRVPLFVFGECGVDLYTFPADDRHYDTDQRFAPFAIRFEHQAARLPTSTIDVRGKPSGGSGTWRARRAAPGTIPSTPLSAYGLRDFREVEPSAPGKRRFAWTSHGVRVASIWWAARAYTVPFDLADAWADLATRVEPLPEGQTWVEVDVPADDENVLLQVEPRLADLTVHDADVVERAQLYPVPSHLELAFSSGIVDNLVDLSVSLRAAPGSMPYPATVEVYEGDPLTGALLTTIAASADGRWTKAEDAALGGRPLPAEGKRVWTAVATDRTGTTYVRESVVNAPRLPYFDAVRSVLSSDLLSVAIYGVVIDPAGLGGTLEYWLPAATDQATNPSAAPTGSVVIPAGSMPYAIGPTAIPALGGVKTAGSSFTVVFKFTATDGRTTGRQPFPLAGSMQFLVDDLGKLRAESVHNGLVLAQQFRPYYLGTGAPSGTPTTYGTDRYFDSAALTPYKWTGSAWAVDASTPAVAYAPILRAGVVTAEVIEATAVRAKLVGAERITADNIAVSLTLAVGQEIRSTAYSPGVTGWRIDAAGNVDFNGGNFRGVVRIDSSTEFAAGYNPATKITTFVQAGAPTARTDGSALVQGDMWYQTTDGNHPHRWSGSSWVSVRDSAAGSTTGLSASIYADSEPTARPGGSPLVQGDQWYKSNAGNKPHIWSGSGWVPSYTSIDGGSIKTGAIQSIVYTPGSAGWIINTDGTAEFNNVTIRGELVGATGTFSGELIAQNVRLSAGGNLVLEPALGFAEAKVVWRDASAATFASLQGNYTGAGQGLRIQTTGVGRNMYFYPGGLLRAEIDEGTPATDETALQLFVGGSGTYSGMRRVKVDSSGFLHVA